MTKQTLKFKYANNMKMHDHWSEGGGRGDSVPSFDKAFHNFLNKKAFVQYIICPSLSFTINNFVA